MDNVRQLTELEATEEALEQAILEESCREYMRLQQQQKLQQQQQQQKQASSLADEKTNGNGIHRASPLPIRISEQGADVELQETASLARLNGATGSLLHQSASTGNLSGSFTSDFRVSGGVEDVVRT